MDDWLSAVPGSGTGAGTVTVTAAPNDTGYTRYAKVRVTDSGGESQEVPVTQLGPGVLYECDYYGFEATSSLLDASGGLLRLPPDASGHEVLSFGTDHVTGYGLAFSPAGSQDVAWTRVGTWMDFTGLTLDGCLLAVPVHEGLYLYLTTGTPGVSVMLYDGEESTELATYSLKTPQATLIDVKVNGQQVEFWFDNELFYSYDGSSDGQDIQVGRPLFIGQMTLDGYTYPPAFGIKAAVFQVLDS